MNNRDIELVNLNYNGLLSDIKSILYFVDEVNVEILIFCIVVGRCNNTERRNFIKTSNIINWLTYKKIRKSDLLVNYEYYKKYIQYAIIELSCLNIIEYSKGSLRLSDKKNREYICDENLIGLAKNIKLDEVRKVLNEH